MHFKCTHNTQPPLRLYIIVRGSCPWAAQKRQTNKSTATPNLCRRKNVKASKLVFLVNSRYSKCFGVLVLNDQLLIDEL